VPDLGQVEAQLLGAGAPFEIAGEDVLGERMDVFARRAPSLRTFLETSADFGDAEYGVRVCSRSGARARVAST
jgi:hypothetical protein